MTESSGSCLTISRVNRLLRPLRNKCNTLAALSKTAVASRVTCSKQSSSWSPESRPPLALLCSSAGSKKLTLDSRSADELGLSRRIHAVCDAFKNIAHVAYGQPYAERVPSLAALCTLIVGRNMPAENSDSTSVSSGEESANEDDALSVDSIYEAVPPHYRRFLIVSHALSMILCICPHHHTLVTILLDHCLSFGLLYESTHLLNIVLAQAFMSPNSSYPPPVTHLAHTSYLLDLHSKWTTGNRLSGTHSSPLPFTTSAFCQAVLGILSQASFCNSQMLWTSEVLNKLLHAVEGCDIDSYISIIHALARSFWETSGEDPNAIRDGVRLGMLKGKLSRMMSNLFDLLFTQPDSHPSAPTPSRICAVVDMLRDCYVARLHHLRMPTLDCPPIDLPDMIITFTAHIFVAFRNSIDNSDHLLDILDDSSPVPTTFSKLMVCFSRHQESQIFGDFAEAFLGELRVYSSAFRSEKLLGLDASLWACALRHFEMSITGSQEGGTALVTRYKRQLMEGVDAAERRCFGDIDSSPTVALPGRSNRARRSQHGRLSGHWQWEDMVGSWIRMTPTHKKRKIDNGHPRTPTRHSFLRPQSAVTSKVVLGPVVIPTPSSTPHRRSSTFSPSSSCSWLSESESRTEDGSEYEYREESDKENTPCHRSSVVKGNPIRRRSSNFFSLLADAQLNRIILHKNQHPKPKPPPFVTPENYVPPRSSQESHHTPHKQKRKIMYRREPPLPVPSGASFPSDDSLDLFAYSTSSPARC